MTSVQLHAPPDVLAALREEDDAPADRGRSVSLTVSIDGLDVVTGTSSTRDLKDQLPTLAQAICLCVFRRPPTATTRLVVEGPGLETRVTLPPDVSPHQVLTTLAGLVDAVEQVERTRRRRAEQDVADRVAFVRAVGAVAESMEAPTAPRAPAPRASHGD